MKRVLLVITLLAALIATSAGAATATGIAPWSNERLTLEVKRLKAQNQKQAVKIQSLHSDVASLRADDEFLFLFFSCNAEFAGPQAPDMNADRADHCAQLAALNY